MTLMKKMLAGVAIAALSSGVAAAATSDADLNLRTGPTTHSRVVGVIPAGANVSVLGCNSGWCRVNFRGEVGYASRHYLNLRTAGRSRVYRRYSYYPYQDYGYYPYDDYGYYNYGYGPSIGLGFLTGRTATPMADTIPTFAKAPTCVAATNLVPGEAVTSALAAILRAAASTSAGQSGWAVIAAVVPPAGASGGGHFGGGHPGGGHAGGGHFAAGHVGGGGRGHVGGGGRPRPALTVLVEGRVRGKFAPSVTLLTAEDPVKDRADVLEVIGEVEIRFEFGLAEVIRHVLVSLQEREEIAFAPPHPHGVTLDELVRVFTWRAFLGQRKQHALRMDEAAKQVEILPHGLRIDDQFVGDAAETRQREIERGSGIGPDHALD